MISENQLEQQKRKIEEIMALQEAADSPAGKRILARLRKITGFDCSGYRKTPHDTAYIAGLRDAYVLLMQEVQADTAAMLRNWHEQKEKAK